MNSLLFSLLGFAGSTNSLITRQVTAAGGVSISTSDCVVIINKTVGAATAVTLPTGTEGRFLVIKDGKGDANSNNITITGDVDGGASYVISSAYGSVSLVFSGAKYYVI